MSAKLVWLDYTIFNDLLIMACKLTQEEINERFAKIHNGKYTYHNDYKNTRTKIKITCPIHGDFFQTPKRHLLGQGCPECGKLYAQTYSKGNYENFIKESIKRFGENFEFPNIKNEYINSHSVITIKCKKCNNVFTKIACDHLTSNSGGCRKCYAQTSSAEQEIGNYIRSLLPNTEIRFDDRNVLGGNRELDIYIPSLNLAIEYDGLFWHNEERKGKTIHLEKTIMCNQKGINLIHIFEDEYINHKDIVLSKLKHVLHKENGKKIMARKCIIKQVNYAIAQVFLDKNHIQGVAKSSIYLGCFYHETLIGVMTFVQESNNKWELNRFATDSDYICQGVGGKLFKYFIRNFNPIEIKSFADRRWTLNVDNNLYTKLGFTLEKILLPDYRYYMKGMGVKRYHKFLFRKQILHKKYGLPLTMTESEMAKVIHAYRIWDCGLFKYVWKNI